MACKFDLGSKIPVGAEVKSASLQFYQSWNNDEGSISCKVYKISRSWTPSNVTWSNFNTQNSTSGVVLSKKFRGSVGNIDTFDISSVLKEWIASPETNFGVMFAKTSGDDISWVSEKSPTIAQRPKLVIEFTGTSVVNSSTKNGYPAQVKVKGNILEIQNCKPVSTKCSITDLKGRVVWYSAVNGSKTFPLELPTGIYIFKVNGSTGHSFDQLIHIQ